MVFYFHSTNLSLHHSLAPKEISASKLNINHPVIALFESHISSTSMSLFNHLKIDLLKGLTLYNNTVL